jgi:TRAP-type C4-dicarboxylate transport system substrate-binding protein
VINGLDNPANTYAARSMWEVVDNISLTSHIMQNQVVVINEQLFQSLSPEFQKILRDAAREAGDYQSDLTIDGDQVALDEMAKHGVVVTTPDLAAFKAATADVYKKFEKNWKPGLYQRIVDTK